MHNSLQKVIENIRSRKVIIRSCFYKESLCDRSANEKEACSVAKGQCCTELRAGVSVPSICEFTECCQRTCQRAMHEPSLQNQALSMSAFPQSYSSPCPLSSVTNPQAFSLQPNSTPRPVNKGEVKYVRFQRQSEYSGQKQEKQNIQILRC